VIKAQNLGGLADYQNDLKEAKYTSNVKEPLGKSYHREYQMPDETSHEQFKYGVPTANSEAAKNVLYPEGGEKEERPEISKLYNRTHGNFGPGE
jgi:hypothetical protein